MYACVPARCRTNPCAHALARAPTRPLPFYLLTFPSAQSRRKLFGRILCEALPDCERPDLTAPEGELNVSAMTVAEVGEWLSQEGFGDAKKAFASNDVDGPALLDLNEARARLAC